MLYTYEQLSKMTVADLRKIADGIEHDAVKGHSTMHKDKLLPALCTALGIEAHVHHDVKGIDKGSIKLKISALKKDREAAIAAKDYLKLRTVRLNIKRLKRTIRKAMA